MHRHAVEYKEKAAEHMLGLSPHDNSLMPRNTIGG
jgi:hypothetical protein